MVGPEPPSRFEEIPSLDIWEDAGFGGFFSKSLFQARAIKTAKTGNAERILEM
jgi:hypothetical protein